MTGTAARRDRLRALIAEACRREPPVATVAAVLAEVVRGRRGEAAVFAGLRRERVKVHPVDSRVAVRAGQLLGSAAVGSALAVGHIAVGRPSPPSTSANLERLAVRAVAVSVASIQPRG